MNRLSSPSIIMEGQLNGNIGENSSSSSSSSPYPMNHPHSGESSSNSTSSLQKPYKPKFHNYKKLDLSRPTTSAATPIPGSSTPNTPSFFNNNIHPLVSFKIFIN